MSNAEEDWTLTVKKLLGEKLDPIDKRLRSVEQSLLSSNREQGETETPVYRCKGEKCGFATDNLSEFIQHSVREEVERASASTARSEAVAETPSPAPKPHKTVADYMNCPECYPKFEKAMLENPRFQATLKAQGFVKEEEKPAKKSKKQGEALPI